MSTIDEKKALDQGTGVCFVCGNRIVDHSDEDIAECLEEYRNPTCNKCHQTPDKCDCYLDEIAETREAGHSLGVDY